MKPTIVIQITELTIISSILVIRHANFKIAILHSGFMYNKYNILQGKSQVIMPVNKNKINSDSRRYGNEVRTQLLRNFRMSAQKTPRVPLYMALNSSKL